MKRRRLSVLGPDSPRTWLQVVQEVRTRFDEQRWRLAALESTEGWRDFAIAWQGAAGLLRDCGAPHVCPADLRLDDDVLAWAWDVVSPRVSEAIEVSASRSRLDELTVLACFESLQGAGLIFPDGIVAKRVVARIEREVMAREAAESLALSHANEELLALQAKQQARLKAQQAQGGQTP